VFRRIKYQIQRFSQRPKLSEGLETEKIKSDWQKIVKKVNKNAIDKSQALYVNNDKELIVRVVDHLWLQEMYLYRAFIEKEVLDKNKIIKSVRFIV